jgi:hypothetical protein
MSDGNTMGLSSIVTAGNKIIVGILWSYDGCPPSFTDSLGSTYSQVGTTQNVGSMSMYWFMANMGASNTNGLTLHAGCGYSKALFIAEYSGVSSFPWDGQNAQANTSSPCTTGSISTTVNNDLILGVFEDGAARGFTAGSGYTERLVSASGHMLEERIQSSAGSISATATCSANLTYGAYGYISGWKAQ